MDFTKSKDYVTAPNGQRRHEDAQTYPTVWSEQDANGLIWELMEVVKAGQTRDSSIVPLTFDETNPSSYNALLRSISAIASGLAAHGNLGGGSLHAVATQTTNGFMSAADKVKLDGLTSGGGGSTPTYTSGWTTSLTTGTTGTHGAGTWPVDFTGTAGDAAQANTATEQITVPVAGAYTLALTSTAGSNTNASLKIYKNGVILGSAGVYTLAAGDLLTAKMVVTDTAGTPSQTHYNWYRVSDDSYFAEAGWYYDPATPPPYYNPPEPLYYVADATVPAGSPVYGTGSYTAVTLKLTLN